MRVGNEGLVSFRGGEDKIKVRIIGEKWGSGFVI